MLNFNGVETLRKVEELEAYQRGVLPSCSSIQKAFSELHELGQIHIPFHRRQCDLGEVFQFESIPFLCFILKTFFLHDVAQHDSVELCITLDGAELCNALSNFTVGIKVTDRRAVDLRDGSPLSCIDDAFIGRIFQTQSQNYCFVVKSLMGKGTNDAYKQFEDFFNSLKRSGRKVCQHQNLDLLFCLSLFGACRSEQHVEMP